MVEDGYTHAQQQYVRLNDAKNSHILYVPHERPLSKYYFSSKTWHQTFLVFMFLAITKATKKNFFSTL